MATNFTAYDMVQWYWDIPVERDANVSINKYLINDASTCAAHNSRRRAFHAVIVV